MSELRTLQRRRSDIEDALARPDLPPGPEWDKRRTELERELAAVRARIRQVRE